MSDAADAPKTAAKRAAAAAAARLVEPNMTVGLGTGSTAALFIEALAERVRRENLSVRGVPTSAAGSGLAARLGLDLVALGQNTRPDLTVDGADEVDPSLSLIKGGGGALVREKLVAVSSRRFVVIVDENKAVTTLGAFPLPVAILPFGWETTRARIQDGFGVRVALRERDGAPFVTDDGLYLLDLHVGPAIADPGDLEARLKTVVGVAEVGLFVGVASVALFGSADGSVRIQEVGSV